MKSPRALIRQQLKIAKSRRRISAAVSNSQPIILIYQMGKVASSSIYHSLEKYPRDCFVFHTHVLNKESTLQIKNQEKPSSFLKPDRRKQLSVDLREQVIDPRHPAKIITLFRDPFARSISAFFENSPIVRQKWPDKESALAQLKSTFFDQLPEHLSIDWFENEFNPTLGINVYEHDFDPEKSWASFESNSYEILMLSTHLPDIEKEKQVADFASIPDFKLERYNTTSNSSRKELYKSFKSLIRFPKSTVDQILASQFCQHFFDNKTRGNLRDRWQE